MVIMEKGHFGQYTGNARHSHTPVTKKNYRASVADDAAHIHYLKEDVNYDNKHGHSDENMTADEKHISKLAGDMKYDKKHHSPFNQIDEREGGVVQPFVDPGAPEGFVSNVGSSYDEEAPSKKFFKNQNIANKAVKTLENIDAGEGTYTGYANSDQTVRNALLGTMRKDKLTTQQLKNLARGDANTAASYISQNIRNAPLGDAKRLFDKSYNPFK
jgi:hypothetical protein